MISVSRPHQLLDSGIYVNLQEILGLNLHVKCEGFNFAGSIKLRTARRLIEHAQLNGDLRPDSVLVESSSGNLGVALAMVAASTGLRFLCVTDPRCTTLNLGLMRALGADVVVVDEAEPNGGFLAARKERVRQMCAADPHYLWLDQYTNPGNCLAHYEATAPVIAKHFPELDVLFVGTGTGGTATGCARYFKHNGSGVRVIAVDTVGSVNFGGAPGLRRIPGLGASQPMPLVEPALYTGVELVAEEDTVRMCRTLARHGLLLGGSSGTVVQGARKWLSHNDPQQELTAVAIAPDLGERYIDTVYDDNWLADNYPGVG
ncbi:2,3-diaminopropionate biosynthesis protein SbnA [Streptomyces anulatus]|uniref:2,3-diaminopropionate biosynthesis protein SbnA n=1 Tax=Streptomyces anulatus TaxID=1892 RepID=UPI0022557D08|nr:2,3-diaminopropionate biosynthesis protein SbnA [Streptomyces anulatus]MCX4501295.1 2,3-diaminopropionate biosynthesis protein SbnA [Streptomyces anulatus]WTD13356.1 2,3-diaminopropionate biosynthesis protein SbnA [Streptomyces anulatus]WTE06666.1 2,3-diaminopropionate biosynthesis protein SbnA [Streptomyces anulatus]